MKKEAKIGDWLKESFEAIKSDLGGYILPSLIFFVLSMTIVCAGPMLCGFYHLIFQRMKGKPAAVGDIFKGFDVFVNALIAYIIVFAVVFIFYLIPIMFVNLILGFLAGAPFIFVFPLIWEKRLPFTQAIKESLQMFIENWTDLVPFYVVGSIVGGIGVVLCGVGIILTFPIYLYATACLYRDWIGFDSPASSAEATPEEDQEEEEEEGEE